jgi:predicted nuclease of predicted toxin-antitoxin system
MQIKLDENISHHLKPLLQREGHEVFTAGEEGLLEKNDMEVGTAAKN